MLLLQLMLLQGLHRRLAVSNWRQILQVKLFTAIGLLPCRLVILALETTSLHLKIAPSWHHVVERGTLQPLCLLLLLLLQYENSTVSIWGWLRLMNAGALTLQVLYLFFGCQACKCCAGIRRVAGLVELGHG